MVPGSRSKDRQTDNAKALNATMHGFNPFPTSNNFCCLPSLLLMYLGGLYWQSDQGSKRFLL